MAKIKVKYGDSWASLESNYPGIGNKNPRTRSPKAGQILQIPDPVIPIQQQKSYLFDAPTVPTTYANNRLAQSGFVDRNRGADTKARSTPNTIPSSYQNGRYNPYAYTGAKSGGLSPTERDEQVNYGANPNSYYAQLVTSLVVNAAMQEAKSSGSSGGSSKKYKRGGEYIYKDPKTGKVIRNWRARAGLRSLRQKPTGPIGNGWLQSAGYGSPVSWRIG